MKILLVCSKIFYHRISMERKRIECLGHELVISKDYVEGKDYFPFKTIEEINAPSNPNPFRHSEKTIIESDAVLVLNFQTTEHGTYIDAFNFLEMYDAFKLGKKIYMLYDYEHDYLKDEILAFGAVVLDRDYTKIV